MSDVPEFAEKRFVTRFRKLRVTDLYSVATGWVKADRGLTFTTGLAMKLLATGTTQVRLRAGRETHDVSILEPTIMRPVAALPVSGIPSP
jgi:hypothetical protein